MCEHFTKQTFKTTDCTWIYKNKCTLILTERNSWHGTLSSVFWNILYIDNANSVSKENRFKYVDDLTTLEIINLLSIGLSSCNFKQHIPSDIPAEGFFYWFLYNLNVFVVKLKSGCELVFVCKIDDHCFGFLLLRSVLWFFVHLLISFQQSQNWLEIAWNS